jgi:hypothetical protein
MTTTRRFASPEILTDGTLILGVPVKEWDKLFVGDFEKTLTEISQKIASQKPSIADDRARNQTPSSSIADAHALSAPKKSTNIDDA